MTTKLNAARKFFVSTLVLIVLTMVFNQRQLFAAGEEMSSGDCTKLNCPGATTYCCITPSGTTFYNQ
jgi:hypothetical protein